MTNLITIMHSISIESRYNAIDVYIATKFGNVIIIIWMDHTEPPIILKKRKQSCCPHQHGGNSLSSGGCRRHVLKHAARVEM
jgi:hypothetical protein